MPVVEQSPFRTAFLNMRLTPEKMKTHEKVIQSASRLLERHAGTRRIPDWNAHLKLKTYQQFVREKVRVDKNAPAQQGVQS